MMFKKASKVKKNIILLLAGGLIAFFALVIFYEIYENLRYSRFKAFYRAEGDLYGELTIASSNKELIWEYRPYGECRSKTREYKGHLVGTIKTNRYGFRDYDYESPDKREGTYRVAFIGDSVTLGLWVDCDGIFVRRFEIEANILGQSQRVQALNFGVDGYNTIQIYEMLKTKVLLFSPDKVVYIMCLNDFDFDEAAAPKIYYFRKPKSFFLKRVKMASKRTSRLEKEDYYFFHYNRNKDRVFPKILGMRDILAQQGTGFLVVIVPVFDLTGKGFDHYEYLKIHDEIKNFLKDNKISVFDLLNVFKEQSGSLQHFVYDVWHPNQEGHRLIAQALLKPILGDVP